MKLVRALAVSAAAGKLLAAVGCASDAPTDTRQQRSGHR
jgi:hypothetical protein